MKVMALTLAAMLAAGGAQAATDPISGAAERFFSLEPGRSSPPSAGEYGGAECDGGGAWWGRFAGGKPLGGSGFNHRTRVHTAQACFDSRGDCEAWMLALKTRYNARPIYNHCRAGYEPGAPVPPWWAPKR